MVEIYYSFIAKERSREFLTYVLKERYAYCGEIKTGENGKPYIDADLHFNVTHSGEVVMIAFSRYPVGLDVEKICGRNYLPVAKKAFSNSECTHVKSEIDFDVLWTKKESALKYLGKRLADIQKVNFDESGISFEGRNLNVNSFSERFDDYVFSLTTTETEYVKKLMI